MNDTKNILLAWVSSISTVFAAIEYRDVIAILSAVVLPAVFFTVGKAVDVAVQIYLNRKHSAGSARSQCGEVCLVEPSHNTYSEPAEQATNRSSNCRPLAAGSGDLDVATDGEAEPHRTATRLSRIK